MILSASRRTDIPSFYTPWFVNRLKEKRFSVRNPFNPKQVTEYRFSHTAIECIVFWTKDPTPMLPALDHLEAMGLPFYFLFTITPYNAVIERYLPDKQAIIETFKKLSGRDGQKRVVWRYDPILLSDRLTHDYHIRAFSRLAELLEGSTDQCTVSFFSPYKKSSRNCADLSLRIPDDDEKRTLLAQIKEYADRYNISLRTCADPTDYSELGIKPAKCIDDERIAAITGKTIPYRKDPYQRPECGCIRSVDLGAYHTCLHGCRYCYANHNHETAVENNTLHDPDSPFLIGGPAETDRVTIKEEL